MPFGDAGHIFNLEMGPSHTAKLLAVTVGKMNGREQFAAFSTVPGLHVWWEGGGAAIYKKTQVPDVAAIFQKLNTSELAALHEYYKEAFAREKAV